MHLAYGISVAKANASFKYDFFQLPDFNPAMLTHSVEVRIQASYSSDGYSEWAAARPELLLLKVGCHFWPPNACISENWVLLGMLSQCYPQRVGVRAALGAACQGGCLFRGLATSPLLDF